MTTYPRSFAHVGVTVPDVEDALDWYEDVLGFQHVMGPQTVEPGDDHIGALCSDVLGDFEQVRIAHMATGNQVGVEFFEFDENDGVNDPEPTDSGFFHVCVIDPDIEALADCIASEGGEHTSDVWRLFPDQEYKMTYCRDPWENIVEIYTHGYERIYSNQGDY